MPLPSVAKYGALQCKAKSKQSGVQCKNPAVTSWGMKVCKFHGARRPSSIKRGAAHPGYRHGQETLPAKAERSAKLAELRDLEAEMALVGVLEGARWRGRKPGPARNG